jgi:hypothetical protein
VSTVVSALYARSAVGVESASTVVRVIGATSASLRRPKHDTIPANDCSNSVSLR